MPCSFGEVVHVDNTRTQMPLSDYMSADIKKLQKLNASHSGIYGPIDQKILSDLRI